MSAITSQGITKHSTGRTYNSAQVLEIVFIQNDGDQYHYYVVDESRIMFFVVTLEIDEPELETMADVAKEILDHYDRCEYNKSGWELEAKGKEIYQAAVNAQA